jgi:hypothetical protein
MGKRRERRDPFADYVEWSNNRYNPGHYLGGNIPPHLRMSRLGPRAQRSAALLQIVSAAVWVGLSLIAIFSGLPFSRLEWLLSVSAGALVIWAAVTMYRKSRRSQGAVQKPVRRGLFKWPARKR